MAMRHRESSASLDIPAGEPGFRTQATTADARKPPAIGPSTYAG